MVLGVHAWPCGSVIYKVIGYSGEEVAKLDNMPSLVACMLHLNDDI